MATASGSSSSECEVFIVANGTQIDEDIFKMWLQGYSAQETVKELLRMGVLQQMPGSDEECVISEVNENFTIFTLIERFIDKPSRFLELCPLQLDPPTVHMMIEKWYEFDDSVIREILGRKLSAKTRKDLDEVSEKSNVRIRSCRRQFDNFRRIYKAVEELKGSLVENIQRIFLLSERLARGSQPALLQRVRKMPSGDLEASYKNIFRVIVSIAVDLNHTRDLRDFFVDIVEKIVGTCKAAKWAAKDVKSLLDIISQSVRGHELIRLESPTALVAWDRYMRVVSCCVVRMYHA